MPRSICLPAIFGILLSALLAQDARVSVLPRGSRKTGGAAIASAANMRVYSDLVLVPVTVTDAFDQPVVGLGKGAFRLYDDKVAQTISHFALEDVPISVAVVFDCSGSMKDKLDRSRIAVNEFLKVSNPEDEFSLITFNNRVSVQMSFGQEVSEVLDRLMFLPAGGRTALIDAVYVALNEMKLARNARKAILIVSDGGDNCSRYSSRDLRKRVRESDVQIYSIAIAGPASSQWTAPEEISGPWLLKDIATQSGGRSIEASPGALSNSASAIGKTLRTQYVLGYSPSQTGRDGRYHSISVKLDQPKGTPKLRASFRVSYFAPLK